MLRMKGGHGPNGCGVKLRSRAKVSHGVGEPQSLSRQTDCPELAADPSGFTRTGKFLNFARREEAEISGYGLFEATGCRGELNHFRIGTSGQNTVDHSRGEVIAGADSVKNVDIVRPAFMDAFRTGDHAPEAIHGKISHLAHGEGDVRNAKFLLERSGASGGVAIDSKKYFGVVCRT